MRLRLRCLIGALVLLAGAAPAAAADRPPAGDEVIKSMGFPPDWKPSAGAMLDWDRRGPGSALGAEFHASIYRDLLNPATAALGWAGEGYVRYVNEEPDGGLRLFLASPAAELQFGVDYSFREAQVDFVLSLTPAFRRGGLFGVGDHLRIDWYPERDNSFMFGIGVPFGQPHMGKTRPRDKQVELPQAAAREQPASAPRAELQAALENVRHAATAIQNYTVPFLDREMSAGPEHLADAEERVRAIQEHIAGVSDLYPGGHSFAAEIEVYHRELERAFALAAGGGPDPDARGAALAATARAILLDRVILPYDRLLGERKKHDSLRGFGAAAGRAFADSLAARADLAAEQRDAARYVFGSVIAAMEENREAARKNWGDSRLVWIPLHCALRPSDLDTQAELDALIERAAASEFTAANHLAYVTGEDSLVEIARMIRSAEEYHVLWIHDYRGLDGEGHPDALGLQMTIEYLRSLAERARAYDTTHRLTAYFIFFDEMYYQANQGRLYLELLADPLRHEMKLPAEFAAEERAIRAAQDELRTAVAGSRALQADAERYGQKWLATRIKVHVSVTNPADVSFRSESLVPHLNFVPDLLMRDHRKISFRDLTETDPGRGEALFTGRGVGEHYVGPTWEDRSILVRGPAILGLKAAAQELLLSQGFKNEEIPAVLRPLPKPADYTAQVAALREQGWRDTAMQVHNATGFGPKTSNVVKAICTTMMPAGSYLFIPDSLWDSPLWGAMQVGAALRGCRVFPICPSLVNAPSEGLPQMTRTGELFTRFLLINQYLGAEIATAGGMLRPGVYANDIPVGDTDKIILAVKKNLDRYPFLRPAFPFDDEVLAGLFAFADTLAARGVVRQYLAGDEKERRPKMHLKVNFFATAEALAAYAPQPEWKTLLNPEIADLAGWLAGRQLTGLDQPTAVELTAERWHETLGRLTSAVSADEGAQAVLYLTVGSQNMNYRSMILDGEVSCVVAGPPALIGYVDCLRILGLSTWVEDRKVLDALLPAPEGFWGGLGRWIKYAI